MKISKFLATVVALTSIGGLACSAIITYNDYMDHKQPEIQETVDNEDEKKTETETNQEEITTEDQNANNVENKTDTDTETGSDAGSDTGESGTSESGAE